MPICSRCRIAYLESEVHACSTEASGAALYFPRSLGPRRRLFAFGATSGCLWALVPIVVTETYKVGQTVPALAVGIVVGVALAFGLAPLLRRWRFATVLIGLAVLPLGTFCSGYFLPSSILQMDVRFILGPGADDKCRHPFMPV